MTECVIYQTLEDRSNYDEVEGNGPFPCCSSRAWLGKGYYFWDDEIKVAHNWAKHAGYNSNYIICESSYDYDNHNYLDLVGHPIHLRLVRDLYQVYKEYCPNMEKKITVPALIEFVKAELGQNFNFQAIRARSELKDYAFTLNFPGKRPATMNLHPQIQICVIDKSFLISPFRIVYPNSAVRQVKSYISE